MTRRFLYAGAIGESSSTLFTLLAAMALVATIAAPAAAKPPTVGLTKVGSPIWRPGDFQMFTAPAAPFPDAFFDTLDALLPLEGPGRRRIRRTPGRTTRSFRPTRPRPGSSSKMSSPVTRSRSTQTASIS